ncbi:endomucin [Phyllostomus hastatus]|uniref:endomucin n=1 Tax=Phyllostomus hastatus TaxID=9423 RepID=UPI001E685029|nr:endomucin [Phyllostomus hastatus]
MKLLQVTILCLLLVSSLRSEGNDNQTTPALTSATPFTTEASFSMQVAKSSSPNVTTSTAGTSPNGTTNKESIQTPPLPTVTSIITTAKGEGATTNGVVMKNLTTATVTVRNLSLPSTVSTLQSAQDKTKNPSSINTTQIPVSTQQPDASTSETSSISPLVSTTIPENASTAHGTQNAKNASPSSTNPSRSSIILPVVITLIVLTLSVFALVGLYRMCRKTDPGTPDNGNDQPQSDKESVKLLTVKTISHESGEHSAQGKTKN